MELVQIVEDICIKAQEGSRLLGIAAPKNINYALKILAFLLRENIDLIIKENKKDCIKARENNISVSDLQRLELSTQIIEEMAEACLYIADFPHPIGVIEEQWQRPNGLLVGKMRVPLGVIAIIYESRPNVTIDAAILCLRAGNAVVLRGGSEAFYSNMCLASLLQQALEKADLPSSAVQIIPTTDREAIHLLCKQNQYIDVLIPRGGEGLIKTVSSLATMPVLKHDKGVCHLYIDETAELEKALPLILNGKVQRPSACNALECVLIHKDIPTDFYVKMVHSLLEHKVELRLCKESFERVAMQSPLVKIAEQSDYGTEFHDLILVIKSVDSFDAATQHIALYGSHHTESICTQNLSFATRFQREVDAALVLVNASTRFNDGGQLGLGAEIGISTSKIHSYGVMGVEELTTTKYTALGDYLIRE